MPKKRYNENTQLAAAETAAKTHADTGLAAHVAAVDPHPGYLTQAEADALYASTGTGVTNGNSHDHNGGDGTQINHTTLSNIGTNTHAQIDTALATAASHIANTSNPHSTTAAQVGAGPDSAVYIVGSLSSGLSAERVVTDTATLAWDQGTAAQLKANVPDNAVTYAKLQQGTARSLLGVAGNATANYAPIQGTTAYNTLRVNSAGTGLEFGAVDLSTAGVTGDLPFSKLVQSAAGFAVVGKTDTGAGDFAEIAIGADKVLGRTGSGNVGAISVDTAQIAADAVTYAKLQNASVGFVVLAKAATGAGDFAELTVAADTVVGRDGSGDVDDITIKNAHVNASAAIALTKLATIAADTMLGSIAGGTPAALAVTATGRSILDDASTQAVCQTLGDVFAKCTAQTNIPGIALVDVTGMTMALVGGNTYTVNGTFNVNSPAADDCQAAIIVSSGTHTGNFTFVVSTTTSPVAIGGTTVLLPTTGVTGLIVSFVGTVYCAASGSIKLQVRKAADTGADAKVEVAGTHMSAVLINSN